MRHIYAFIGGAAALALSALVLAPIATARPALVELRVEGPQRTLDPGTWYVTRRERARKAKPSDACKRTTGRIRVPGPTPLSLAQSGAEANRDLRQVRVRRDEAGLFACEIGSIRGRPFTDPAGFAGWSYYDDLVFGSASADQLKLKSGDSILWVFSDFGAASPANTGAALELRGVPPRDEGTFVARVVAHAFDGSTTAATGATIHGANAVQPLTQGRYRIQVGNGTTELYATRGLDIASNHIETCSLPELAKCPLAHGRTIVGDRRANELAGTPGFDEIRARAGADVIGLRRGGRDEVDCGAGKDVVLIRRGDRDDRIAPDCERVRRR